MFLGEIYKLENLLCFFGQDSGGTLLGIYHSSQGTIGVKENLISHLGMTYEHS
jgi:hypothetical protein